MSGAIFSLAIYCDSDTRPRRHRRQHAGPRQLVRVYHYGTRVTGDIELSWWWNNDGPHPDLDTVLPRNHDSDPAVPDDRTGLVLAPPEQQCPMCGPATWIRPLSPDEVRVVEVSSEEASRIGWAPRESKRINQPAAHPLASHRHLDHLDQLDQAHRPVQLRCPDRSCGMAVRLPDPTLLAVLDQFRRAGIADLPLGRLAPYADGRVPK